jgi:parvulin-like peptidyl-prolyl isomerase
MKPRISLLVLLIAALGLLSCRSDPTLSPTPTATSTPQSPTETPTPIAALVSGEPIYLSDFEDELARYRDAHGTDLATSEANETVLRALIDRKLLAQGAKLQGYSFDEAMIDQKIDQLIVDLGEEAVLQTWLQRNHYTLASFRDALAEENLASAMVGLIVEGVSKLDVHANALHILVATESEAGQLRGQILSGADFAELAVIHSLDLSTRPAGGDLGWFARGTLTIPEVEEIVFSLQPGDLSEVIDSELGFHLILLIDLEERPLSFPLLESRREQAVENWLIAQREITEIEINLVPSTDT